MKIATLMGTAVVLAFTAGQVMAAPCNTDASKAKTPNEQAANPKSSDVDRGSKNLAGGEQPASPGTVGAMNNVGANQMVGDNKAGMSDKAEAGSKNLAGGEQPASPGTVGAMNNTGENQRLGKDDDC